MSGFDFARDLPRRTWKALVGQLTEPSSSSSPNASDTAWASVFFAASYVSLVGTISKFRDVYEFDPDEGNNVVKALLLEHGFRFGTDIWSDQPPLYSYLLWGTFRLFGWEVAHARLLTLGLAGLLLFAVYDMVRREAGHVGASAAGLLLVCSLGFVELSVAAMLGLPAIALATLSVWSVARFRSSAWVGWLAISALALGAALATKLFVAFLVPACALPIFLWERKRGGLGRAAGLALGWCVLVTGVLALGLLPLLTSGKAQSLYRAHLAASDVTTPLRGLLGEQMVPSFLKDDLGLYVLALIGALGGLLKRQAFTALASLWLFLGLVALWRHHPVWTHHRLLLTVPGALLAGAGVSGLFGGLLETRDRKPPRAARLDALRGAVVLSVIGMIYSYAPGRFERMLKPPAWSNRRRDTIAEDVIRRYMPDTRYMVSARQMFAFRAGAVIPPNLAVTSTKRFISHLLDADAILHDIDRYEPEQVILTARWPGAVRARIRERLGSRYFRVHQDRQNQRLEIYVPTRLAEKYGDLPKTPLPDGAPPEGDEPDTVDDLPGGPPEPDLLGGAAGDESSETEPADAGAP